MEISKIMFKFVFIKWLTSNMKTLFTLSSKELSKKSGIYKLSCGGHLYIGSSKSLYSRLIEHRTDLLKNKHPNDFLQKVSNKYGIQNINVEILEFCDPQIRINREKYWIDYYKSDMNLQDPVTNELSEYSRKKLSNSIRQGVLNGKYKTQFDFCEVEQYNYFGEFMCKYKNKEDAALQLNLSKKDVQKLASGYKKGVCWNGIRLRYSNSEVPVQKFEINPQYIGKHFDFYYLDDNKNEQFAFSNVKDVWKFLAMHLKLNKQIILIPKLKLRESGNVLTDNAEDNPNPST